MYTFTTPSSSGQVRLLRELSLRLPPDGFGQNLPGFQRKRDSTGSRGILAEGSGQRVAHGLSVLSFCLGSQNFADSDFEYYIYLYLYLSLSLYIYIDYTLGCIVQHYMSCRSINVLHVSCLEKHGVVLYMSLQSAALSTVAS